MSKIDIQLDPHIGEHNKKSAKTYHHGNLREALLDAAELELREKGIEKFSLRGVAKRAGVSHAAPAHHFGDADGLLTALAGLSFERFTHAMQLRSDTTHGTAEDKLIAIGMAYIDYATEHAAMFDLQFSSKRVDTCHPSLKHISKASYMVLYNHVEAVLAARGQSFENAPDAAHTIWATTHGLAALFTGNEDNNISGERYVTFERILKQIISGF